LIQQAKEFATEHHKYDKYGNEHYMKHINDVVSIAYRYNCNADIVIGCYLHDTIEMSETPKYILNLIVSKFGNTIGDIVWAVTDEQGKNRAERHAKTYPKIKANKNAVIVKLCDRLANIEACKSHNNLRLLKMYKSEFALFKAGIAQDTPSKTEIRLWQQIEFELT